MIIFFLLIILLYVFVFKKKNTETFEVVDTMNTDRYMSYTNKWK